MIELMIPSKTFFVGEYLALSAGPALVACTEPPFKISVANSKEENGSFFNMHSRSASFRFFQHHKIHFKKTDCLLDDPHEGQGGFGASGAQFLALSFLLAKSRKSRLEPLQVRKDLLQMTETEVLPSGYDVVAQLSGGLAHIDIHRGGVDSYSWNFPDVEFAIVRTGFKVNTHDHLSPELQFESKKLLSIAETTIEDYIAGQNSFFKGVTHYYNELINQNLICESSRQLVEQMIDDCPVFLAAKACGAAGADTILLFYSLKNKTEAHGYFKRKKLQVVYAGQKFSQGLSESMLQKERETEV